MVLETTIVFVFESNLARGISHKSFVVLFSRLILILMFIGRIDVISRTLSDTDLCIINTCEGREREERETGEEKVKKKERDEVTVVRKRERVRECQKGEKG